MIAISTAGHDKDRVYLIIGCKEKIALIVNGTNRSFDNPKKKRVKHLKIIYVPDKQMKIISNLYEIKGISERNALIRKFIKDSISQSTIQGG